MTDEAQAQEIEFAQVQALDAALKRSGDVIAGMMQESELWKIRAQQASEKLQAVEANYGYLTARLDEAGLTIEDLEKMADPEFEEVEDAAAAS